MIYLSDESIISIYLPRHWSRGGPFPVSTLLAEEATIIPNIGSIEGFEYLEIAILFISYIFVARSALKPCMAASVLTVAGYLRFICLYLIFLERISIRSMAIEGEIVGLISIVPFQFIFFWLFTSKVCIISGSTIEPCRIRSVMATTMSRLLDNYLVWNIAFFVFCFVIKFGCVWLISISSLMTCWFTLLTLIVGSICWFEEVRVIVCFI